MNVLYSNRARKDLAKLTPLIREKIIFAIDTYATMGESRNCKKLKGYDNRYRIRINDYRAVFDVLVLENTLFVIRIAHRRDVYKGL